MTAIANTTAAEDRGEAARLEGVTFGYGADRPVLRAADLAILEDDFLAIVGPNGSGKTTLLKLLLGLLEPQAGTVRVLGGLPAEARARVGYVPQHARIDALTPATALDVVLCGRLRRSSWGPRYSREDRSAARTALRRCGSEAVAERPIGSLSGGQRQRVLIARALASEIELLLLDEPTTGVDLHGEQELMELLEELNASLPIVMVSHDVGLVSARLKRVACVGRTISIHPAHEITPERLGELYGEPMAVVAHGQHEH